MTEPQELVAAVAIPEERQIPEAVRALRIQPAGVIQVEAVLSLLLTLQPSTLYLQLEAA
jgi:hypothetical protein